jgi:hypothetical protein
MYLKMMREMAKRDSSLDLLSLTGDEVCSRVLPCISVKKAVEAGLLPVVRDYRVFDHEI